MKKATIKLQHFTPPDKFSPYTRHKVYRVQLYFSHMRSFTNKKQALNYLADASRFMNERFSEINYLCADIYVEYRNCWPYIQNVNTSNFIDQQFYNIGNQMNRWLNNYGLQQNFNAFDRLYKTSGILMEILNKLETIQKSRYNAAPASIKVLKLRLENCKKLVNEFLEITP